MIEGSTVSFAALDNRITLIPENDQSGVTASIDSMNAKVCGTSDPSSSLGSDPKKRGEINER